MALPSLSQMFQLRLLAPQEVVLIDLQVKTQANMLTKPNLLVKLSKFTMPLGAQFRGKEKSLIPSFYTILLQ